MSSINLKKPKKPNKNRFASLYSRDRHNNRLSVVQTKKEARRVLNSCDGSIAESAEHCGVSYGTFRYWLTGERRAPSGLKKK